MSVQHLVPTVMPICNTVKYTVFFKQRQLYILLLHQFAPGCFAQMAYSTFPPYSFKTQAPGPKHPVMLYYAGNACNTTHARNDVT